LFDEKRVELKLSGCAGGSVGTVLQNAEQKIEDNKDLILMFFDLLESLGIDQYSPMRDFFYAYLKGGRAIRIDCKDCGGNEYFAHSLALTHDLVLCNKRYLDIVGCHQQRHDALDTQSGARRCIATDAAALILHELWHRGEYWMWSDSFLHGAPSYAVTKLASHLFGLPGEARATAFDSWLRYIVKHRDLAADGSPLKDNVYCCPKVPWLDVRDVFFATDRLSWSEITDAGHKRRSGLDCKEADTHC